MIIKIDKEDFDIGALTQEIEALTATVDAMKNRITGWRSKRQVKIDFIINNNIVGQIIVIENNIKTLNEKWDSTPDKTDEECSAIAVLNKGFDGLKKNSKKLYRDLYDTRYQGSYMGDYIANFFVNAVDRIVDKCIELGKPPFVLNDKPQDNDFDTNDLKKDTYMLAVVDEICCITNDIEELKKYIIKAVADCDPNYIRSTDSTEKFMLLKINNKAMDFKNKMCAINKRWANEPNKTDEKIALIAKLNNKADELNNNVNLINSDYSKYSKNCFIMESIFLLMSPQGFIACIAVLIIAIAVFNA